MDMRKYETAPNLLPIDYRTAILSGALAAMERAAGDIDTAIDIVDERIDETMIDAFESIDHRIDDDGSCSGCGHDGSDVLLGATDPCNVAMTDLMLLTHTVAYLRTMKKLDQMNKRDHELLHVVSRVLVMGHATGDWSWASQQMDRLAITHDLHRLADFDPLGYDDDDE